MTAAQKQRLMPWIALGIIWVVWGSTYLAISIVVREVPPLAAACVRFLSAGVVMALLAWRFDGVWPTRRQFADYALVGVLLLAFGNALVMWAEQRIPSGITALLVATVPLWMTLADGLRPGGQPWSVRGWVGSGLGLIGVAFIARPAAETGGGHWAGVFALLAASITWTAGAIYSQVLPKRLPVMTSSAIQMLAGGLVLAVESRLLGEDATRLLGASRNAWLGIAYLAVFGSLVGFTAFAYCLNELPASTVGTYGYVNPVVAVFLGSVFLGEPLSAGLLAGAALILLAVILTTRRPSPPRPAVGTPTLSRRAA